MKNEDADRLLEQSLSGDPPTQAFRARVLLDSTAVLGCARRGGPWWRFAALRIAAVVAVAMSFLLGRLSAPLPGPMPVIADADTVTVPSELVAWLNTARLFKQLGMEDRMGRALDHVNSLLPADAIPANNLAVMAVEDSDGQQSPQSANPIMAHSLGGYTHANEME